MRAARLSRRDHPLCRDEPLSSGSCAAGAATRWPDRRRPLTPGARLASRFFADARGAGLWLIVSLSYELFDRALPGRLEAARLGRAPALTGWVPPSTLLSPANAGGDGLAAGGRRRFRRAAAAAGLPVQFQIGEPWWWVMRRRAHLPLRRRRASGARRQLRPRSPTCARRARRRADRAARCGGGAAGGIDRGAGRGGARGGRRRRREVLLLVFCRRVLDPAMPELRRANLPLGWAAPGVRSAAARGL